MEEYRGISISESDIAEYVYPRLVARGYVPDSNEILDVAEILFDFLLGQALIMEYERGDED